MNRRINVSLFAAAMCLSFGLLTGCGSNSNNTKTATSTYVYYASGQESINDGPNYYAVAGAVTIDANGNITGGEQDYNDAYGITATDTIQAGKQALVVDPTTGVGTLTITTADTLVGVNGVETFAVQFANVNHALISQFDGTSTSSGSFDLQTATNASGNFSFAASGVDGDYNSIDFGGVYSVASGALAGVIDVNDDGDVMTGNSFSATSTSPDAFGRMQLTGITNPVSTTGITFAVYVVGPEVVRFIDIDADDSAVGSAYGQGSSTTFTSASLGSSVFGLLGQWDTQYATLGQFSTDGNGNFTAGMADDNEMDNEVQELGDSLAGSTYTLSSTTNGYGAISLAWGSAAENVVDLGVYMVDPNLNINDPNNTTTDVGGALVADMDSMAGGVGVITPQTDTTAADFNGSYAAGFQEYNEFNPCGYCELDMVGPFTMSNGTLSTAAIGADVSDPFGTWSGTASESTGNVFTSTPLSVTAGYFSMSQLNTTPNQLAATINGLGPGIFDADIYQASATTLYWVEFDSNGVFLGPLEQQGSLTALPAVMKPVMKIQPKQNNLKPIKGLGGTVR